MKTVALWLIGLVGLILAGVCVNLISNQVEAWLPLLARRIVRHQAKRMGARALRCEEEWLAHLDQTHGSLHQLAVALGTVFVPLLTVIEKWRDSGEKFNAPAAAVWIRDHASLTAVVAVVLLLIGYPPDPSRNAAYGFLIPLLVFCGLYLAPPFRRAFAEGYESLTYFGRVGVGSLTVPVIGYLAIALGQIPPSRPALNRSPVVSRGAPSPALIFFYHPSRPVDVERRSARASKKTTHVKPHERNWEPPSLPTIEPLDLSELPVIPIPEQPIPSPSQTFHVPSPPTRLRLISPSSPSGLRLIRVSGGIE